MIRGAGPWTADHQFWLKPGVFSSKSMAQGLNALSAAPLAFMTCSDGPRGFLSPRALCAYGGAIEEWTSLGTQHSVQGVPTPKVCTKGVAGGCIAPPDHQSTMPLRKGVTLPPLIPLGKTKSQRRIPYLSGNLRTKGGTTNRTSWDPTKDGSPDK